MLQQSFKPKTFSKKMVEQRIVPNYFSNESSLIKSIESLRFIDEPAHQNTLTAQMSSMSQQCNIHFAIIM